MSNKMLIFVDIGKENPLKRDTLDRKEDFIKTDVFYLGRVNRKAIALKKYELIELFDSEPAYRWEFSFNIVGLPMGLIVVSLFLFFITRNLIKTIFKK